MNRSRDYYRHHRERVINKRKKFVKMAGNTWHYQHDGQFSKGKIHCSCWMCSGKTKYHGLSIADKRKRDRQAWQEER